MSDVAPVGARTTGPGETRALAAALSAVVRPGDVLLLAGDLGAGKTTFAQGFAAGLGVAEPVTSPTFTLVRAYACAVGEDTSAGVTRPATLLHADLYRLDHLQEVVDLGLPELVEEGAVALVEWGDLAAPALTADPLMVRLEADASDPDVRHVAIDASGAWAARRAQIADALAPWSAGVGAPATPRGA